MKAVITAAGRGSRSGLDGKFRKEMLPLYDCREGRLVLRPIIDCIITGLISAGIKEIACVIRHDDPITRHYLKAEFPDIQMIFQDTYSGYGDAVRRASDFVNGESFILNAGDGFLSDSDGFLKTALKEGGSGRSILNLMAVDDPTHYGCPSIIESGGQIYVTEVEEKPAIPKSNYGLCATYLLAPDVMNNLLRDRSEVVELTPAINMSLSGGKPAFARVILREKWLSVGNATKYAEILKRSLEEAKIREC